MPCRGPAQLGIHRMQFSQGIGPQAREHQVAIHRQGTVPLRDQRLRVGCRVQRHVGPQHLHTRICWHTQLGVACAPARRTPPRLGQRLPCRVLAMGCRFVDLATRFGIACAHERMRLQAATHYVPMAPRFRGLANPLQAVLHAAGHFFMKPGRYGGGCCMPAGRSNGINGGGALGGRHGPREYIDSCFLRA